MYGVAKRFCEAHGKLLQGSTVNVLGHMAIGALRHTTRESVVGR